MKILISLNVLKLKLRVKKKRKLNFFSTNRGGEYISNKFSSYCEENGIIY